MRYRQDFCENLYQSAILVCFQLGVTSHLKKLTKRVFDAIATQICLLIKHNLQWC